MNTTVKAPILKGFIPEPLIVEMTYEQLLELRFQANTIIEEQEAAVKIVNEELSLRLDAEKLTGKAVGNWGISKAVRFSFKTTLEEAQALAATKEVPDPAKLKKLLAAGVAIPGVSKSEYIMVRQIEKEQAA